MSDTTDHEGNRRRRRRSGGRSRSHQSGGASGTGGGTRLGQTPRAGKKEPSGFQQLLHTLSFGLLGQAKSKRSAPRSSSTSAAAAQRSTPNRSDAPRAPREARPKRDHAPVNPADITTERLYVGNLSYDASESDLFELFNGVGTVRNAEVVVNNRTQRSKGFAFVTMGTVEEARRAVQELNNKDFMGRPLQLSGAKPLGEGDSRSRGDDSDES